MYEAMDIKNGVGDMAWDYLFVGWIEGSVTSGAQLMTISIGVSTDRPWFEIWCIMLIVLFFIFASYFYVYCIGRESMMKIKNVKKTGNSRRNYVREQCFRRRLKECAQRKCATRI
eukprot:TRINITY_DN1544_c0_g1_i1.p1 TRINITY_DN1544_c0_g1~~TRINITY_DN1544_c0_g1_i1.p1  ORF type:complete len:115 (+),score=17.23 TRINITY_DN1544_c0_g1_i1:480-824(+)